jgi:hypothetical protein
MVFKRIEVNKNKDASSGLARIHAIAEMHKAKITS